MIELSGATLHLPQLIALGAFGVEVAVPEASLEDVDRSHGILAEAAAAGSVYGASTGVGANKSTPVEPSGAHARALLMSHCAAVGPLESASVNRMAMAIRLNQLASGRSGISRPVVEGLRDALVNGSQPAVHSYGTIGTGDIAQLAELGLTLTGTRRWVANPSPPVQMTATDALPFISSSAFTLARLAEAANECQLLLAASEIAATVTMLALDGCEDAWHPDVHLPATRPGTREVSARLWIAVHEPGRQGRPSQVQDPISVRSTPVTLAAGYEATNGLIVSVERECASSLENPLVLGARVLHHGMFLMTDIAGHLDRTLTAALSTLVATSARLSILMNPAFTDAAPFLSDGKPGSSGLMITEYVAQDLLARAQAIGGIRGVGPVAISLGIEDQASFVPQTVGRLAELCRLGRLMVSMEALAAVRTLRLKPARRRPVAACRSFDLLADHVSPELSDAPVGDVIDELGKALWTMADERLREESAS